MTDSDTEYTVDDLVAEFGEAEIVEALRRRREQSASDSNEQYGKLVDSIASAVGLDAGVRDVVVLCAVSDLSKRAERLAEKLQSARAMVGKQREAIWWAAYGSVFVAYVDEEESPESVRNATETARRLADAAVAAFETSEREQTEAEGTE